MSNLSNALSHLMEAVSERDKARGNCDSSWGYFGYDYEKKVKEAETDFLDAMIESIDRRRVELGLKPEYLRAVGEPRDRKYDMHKSAMVDGPAPDHL